MRAAPHLLVGGVVPPVFLFPPEGGVFSLPPLSWCFISFPRSVGGRSPRVIIPLGKSLPGLSLYPPFFFPGEAPRGGVIPPFPKLFPRPRGQNPGSHPGGETPTPPLLPLFDFPPAVELKDFSREPLSKALGAPHPSPPQSPRARGKSPALNLPWKGEAH